MAAATGWFILGPEGFPPGRVIQRLQLMPSALAATMGTTLFWFVMTLLFGRLYCSTVCPVGTFQDIFIRTRRRLAPPARPGRFVQPVPTRFSVMWIYLATLVAGWLPLAWIIEPWNMARNAASAFQTSPAWAAEWTWRTLGWGAAAGGAAGIAGMAVTAIWAWRRGRAFCNTVCPLGTMMGAMTPWTLYHIEIDPDSCISCGRCEDVCRAGCIKVVSRYVDNARCVRCLDCTAICPEEAIRYRPDRNRRIITPPVLRTRARIHNSKYRLK